MEHAIELMFVVHVVDDPDEDDVTATTYTVDRLAPDPILPDGGVELLTIGDHDDGEPQVVIVYPRTVQRTAEMDEATANPALNGALGFSVAYATVY